MHRHRRSVSPYAHALFFALVATRSITRMLATASAIGVGTGVSSMMARAKASACKRVLVARIEADFFNRDVRCEAQLHPHAARPIDRRVERDLNFNPARRAEDVDALIRHELRARR